MTDENSKNLPEKSQEVPEWQPPQAENKTAPKSKAKPKTAVAGHIPTSLDENEVEFVDLTQKIYMRSVKGRFNNWRVAMIWFTQILFTIALRDELPNQISSVKLGAPNAWLAFPSSP